MQFCNVYMGLADRIVRSWMAAHQESGMVATCQSLTAFKGFISARGFDSCYLLALCHSVITRKPQAKHIV